MVNAWKNVKLNQILRWSLLKRQALDGRGQFSHVTDQPVGFEFDDWDVRISELHADHRNAGGAAFQFQAAFDQPTGARANHVARGMEGDRRQALATKNKIERVDQVGRRVHERAIEIEYDSAGRGH